MAQPFSPARTGSTYDYLCKLLVIGDSSVGKSALLEKFTADSFSSIFISTIGIDFKIKTIMIGDKKIKLQIWDTAGQERFRVITSAYYRGAMGVLIVFDLHDHRTFTNIRGWFENLEQHNNNDDIQRIIVGNKSDLERRVPKEEIDALVKEFKVSYFETSAKTGHNVNEVFQKLGELCHDSYIRSTTVPRVAPVIINPSVPPTPKQKFMKLCGL